MKPTIILSLCLLILSCSNPSNNSTEEFVNEIQFTLNGSGFNNVTYKFDSYRSTRLNGAKYIISSGATSCNVSNVTEGEINQSLISFAFYSKDTGNYSLAEPELNSLRVFINVSKDSILDAYTMRDSTAGNIKISHYPKVGEKVEGTFSSIIADVRVFPSPKYQIKGTFKIIRLDDIN